MTHAIELYLNVIELKPDYIDAHYFVGSAYNHLELYDEAIVYYLNVVELQPDYPDAYYFLASAYSNLEQYEKSIESFKKAN